MKKLNNIHKIKKAKRLFTIYNSIVLALHIVYYCIKIVVKVEDFTIFQNIFSVLLFPPITVICFSMYNNISMPVSIVVDLKKMKKKCKTEYTINLCNDYKSDWEIVINNIDIEIGEVETNKDILIEEIDDLVQVCGNIDFKKFGALII